MGASFEEVVTGAESLRPVLLLKAVVNSVTFRLTTISIIIIIIIIITRPRPAFGRLGLGGSSGGYSSHE